MTGDVERRARAGEYVLGTLAGEAMAEAEAAMAADPEFRATVHQFASQMGRLDMTAEPEPPPAGLWERIAARIADTPQDQRTQAVQIGSTDRHPHSVRRWSGVALAASLLLGVALGYLGGWLTTTIPTPVVLVVLETPENVPGAIFEAYNDNSVRIFPLQDFAVPEGKVLQVWTLYDQAVGPVSLGTLPRAEVARLDGRNLPVPADNQLYEITLEPSPGSPTGRPTGQILVKGFAKRPQI